MPELAEVTKYRLDLNKLFEGKDLLSIEIVGGKFLKTGVNDLNKVTFPLHNTQIANKGKFLYWTFSEDVVFFNTLGMSGSFGNLNKHSALKFNFDSNKNIHFNDIRRFGNFKVASTQELEKKLDSLGWDPFLEPDQPNWVVPTVKALNRKTIAEVLMDQELYAGIGNWIKNEILYMCKIHPNQSVESLSDTQIFNLGEAFKEIANAALKLGGATIATYSDIYGASGSFSKQFKVYSQKLDPEGNPVIKIKTKDKRSSFYVDKYQKL